MSSRNDPDEFASAGKDHRQHSTIDHPDRNPPFLVVSVRALDDNRSIENSAGALKRDAMLEKVRFAFLFVPFEAVCCQ
jgi:hypothetical protein